MKMIYLLVTSFCINVFLIFMVRYYSKRSYYPDRRKEKKYDKAMENLGVKELQRRFLLYEGITNRDVLLSHKPTKLKLRDEVYYKRYDDFGVHIVSKGIIVGIEEYVYNMKHMESYTVIDKDLGSRHSGVEIVEK